MNEGDGMRRLRWFGVVGVLAAMGLIGEGLGLAQDRPSRRGWSRVEEVEAGAGWSVFPGDGWVPGHGRHVHDPTVLWIGGRYWCFSTSGNGFGVLRSSEDLGDWVVHGPVVAERPAWLTERIPQHRSIWAPDVLRLPDGRLRLYYCASARFGANDSVIGAMECQRFDAEKPAEVWRDLGKVIESRPGREHFNAIDPETIIDAEGRHWMFFGSFFSGVYVVELDPETGLLKRPQEPELILVARNSREPGNPVEAPAVMYREGWYYLFLSYGAAAQGVRSTYRIVVGRSRSVTGPYVDLEGRPMTEGGHTVVLKSSPPMFGPGHCDVFQDAGGRWLLAYHYYDGRRYWVDEKWGLPTLQIRLLIWSEDGWPLAGPVVPEQWAGEEGGEGEVTGRWLHQVDFTDPAELELTVDGRAKWRDREGRWQREGRELMIRWPNAEAPGGEWVDRLYLWPGGKGYVGRNQRGLVIRGARLE